jgi:hypothetical protein
MIKFEFKQTNELIAHYRPPTPVVDSSASDTDRALLPDSAPVQAVLPDPRGTTPTV